MKIAIAFEDNSRRKVCIVLTDGCYKRNSISAIRLASIFDMASSEHLNIADSFCLFQIARKKPFFVCVIAVFWYNFVFAEFLINLVIDKN